MVNYSTTGGTAVAGTDYEALPGTVTITAGQSSVAVPVVQRPTRHEEDRTLVITLEPGIYSVSASAGSATMTLKPQPAHWALNGTTLSDGVWTLTVSKSGNDLTVTKYLAGEGVLDFTNLERETGCKVTVIGSRVFWGNTALTALIGPDIVALGPGGDLVFDSCTSVVDVRVPKVERICGSAFHGCCLYVKGGYPAWGGTRCFDNSGTTMPLIRVYVTKSSALDSWREHCLATKTNPGAYTDYFGSGKYAGDAPAKTIGLVRLNTGTGARGYAWLVDVARKGLSIIIR